MEQVYCEYELLKFIKTIMDDYKYTYIGIIPATLVIH